MSVSSRERPRCPFAKRCTSPSNGLTVRTAAVEPVVLLEFSGVLGLIESGRAISTVARALRSAPGGVVVCDVSRLTVLGTSALSAFPTALRRVGGWPSSSLHLAAPDPVLEVQLLSMRMARYLPVHAALDDALIAAELDVVLDRCEVSLPPVAASVPRAREALRTLYPPGPGDPGRQDALVVVSELATNAVRHVARPFTVAMARSPARLVLAVHDPSDQEPILRPPRRSAASGRGMHLVAELSDDWGVRLNHPRGKTVWACLPPPRPPIPVPPRLAVR